MRDNDMAKLNGPNADTATSNLKRRTILRGAAWSIPVIAVAIPAPANAASDNCSASGTHVAPAPTGGSNVTNSSRISHFTVPGGVRQLFFDVVGGAGGSTVRAEAAGGRVQGLLDVQPGDVLTLIVGQGGLLEPTGATGGQGYGNGGDTFATSIGGADYVSTETGGSGGGGSAIMLGDSPLVVAGGGGGSGKFMQMLGGGYPFEYVPTAESYVHRLRQSPFAEVKVERGSHASAALAGRGGRASFSTVSGANHVSSQKFSGISGVAGPSANGARGMTATMLGTTGATHVKTARLNNASGGGGGGYSGGGSGALVGVQWSEARSGGFGEGITLDSAGGGRGGNYWSYAASSATESDGENYPRPGTRTPGSILLSWTC